MIEGGIEEGMIAVGSFHDDHGLLLLMITTKFRQRLGSF